MTELTIIYGLMGGVLGALPLISNTLQDILRVLKNRKGLWT